MKRILLILKYLFYFTVLAFAAMYAIRNGTALLDSLGSVSIQRILAASALVVLGYLLRFSVWRKITAGFGFESPLDLDARTWFFSYLGRYMPGNAGLAAVRLTAYPGVERRRIVGATMVEYGLTLGAAACHVLLGLAWLSADLPGWIPIGVLCFASVLLFLTSPWMLGRIIRILPKITKKPSLDAVPDTGRHLAAMGISLLASAMHGVAFFILLSSGSHPHGLQSILAASSGYFLGGLAGAVFILSPAGIGVREAVVTLALSATIGTDRVVVAAGLMRALTVAAELLLSLFFSWMTGRRGRVKHA